VVVVVVETMTASVHPSLSRSYWPSEVLATFSSPSLVLAHLRLLAARGVVKDIYGSKETRTDDEKTSSNAG
jgi:hypothetical protein